GPPPTWVGAAASKGYSAEARKATRPATSSGRSGRPSGIPAVRRFQASPGAQPSSADHSRSSFSQSGVCTTPGQMQFDVTRWGANAWAAVRVRLTTAAFDAAYGAVRGRPPRYAAIEAV